MALTVDQNIGPVTAYAYARSKGYTGTEEEFAQLMADLGIIAAEFNSFSVVVIGLEEGAAPSAQYNDGVLLLGIPKGDTGNGIASAVLNPDYTLTLNWTNGSSYTTPSIRGAKGETGATGATGLTPDIQIGTVRTLEPGSDATVVRTGTNEEPVFNWGIPQGEKGDTGDRGPIGITPDMSIGTVQTLSPSSPATASITGTPEEPILNLGIPKGDTGSVDNLNVAYDSTNKKIVITF